jgi:tRNA modification GTPase
LKSTIAAISTPPGKGGVAVIRISGPNSIKIVSSIFNKRIKDQDSRKMIYGRIVANSQTIDEVMVVPFFAPNSYTGEDMVEIHCHGGLYVQNKILSILLEKGANMAQGGEFTKRAVINGKMDLIKAEGILSIIESESDAELSLALNQRFGKLSKEILNIREGLIKLSAIFETYLNYPDDIEGPMDSEDIKKKIQKSIVSLKKILENANKGILLENGANMSIIGKPNVGKSSLMNALLKNDRVIVSNIPGTTRDIVKERLNIKGLILNIIDTAGIRESEDFVEKLGIEKTKEYIQQSDLVLFILDASEGISKDDSIIMEMIKGKNSIIAINKIDISKNTIDVNKLKKKYPTIPILEISALTKSGIEKLEDQIYDSLIGKNTSYDKIYITTLRQKKYIQECLQNLDESLNVFDFDTTLVADSIRRSINSLDMLSGRIYHDDLMDEIFSNFCVGK